MGGGGHAHIEKEKGEHSLENISGEGLHHRLALLARQITDHHTAEKQDLGSLREGLLQDMPEGCIRDRGPPLALG